jgi:energy-coupling factor transporter ATP-binding protein EcfA2
VKYNTFKIQNYKGIEDPLTIDINKNSLIPIIGVNEVGKTTILQAIFGFDYINDPFNKTVRHLDDIRNRYESAPKDPKISAVIEISLLEMQDILKEVAKDNDELKNDCKTYTRKLKTEYSGTLQITRNLITKKYSIDGLASKNVDFDHQLAQEITTRLPYILFFDDFRDSIDSRIEIKTTTDGKIDGWLAIIDRLFRRTDKEYNILDLPSKEERDRKGIISNVNRTLEKVLTTEWKNFRLEDRPEALKIRLDYEKEPGVPQGDQPGEDRHYIKFDVVEKDKNGQEYFFYIRDRSKGFYWFFNFVMKLEFNPKVIDNTDTNAIYLLDEPGSYLHAHAQVKLCKKLSSISKDNKIIYCTHSHYLLNPEVIPVNSIRVADKDPETLRISLKNIHEFDGLITDKKSAFQPIIDALQIKPFGLDLGSQSTVIIVEGIYDYYCFEMMKDNKNISFIPGSNADSIRYLTSLMIGWEVDYRALWDSDKEGTERYKDALKFFGEEEAKRFIQLPPNKKILQQLFEGSDLTSIRTQLGIIGKSSFEKTILTLFYSDNREEILHKVSKKTKDNFKKLIADLEAPIN